MDDYPDCPATQCWSIRSPYFMAARSVEPGTAYQLWLVTEVSFFSPDFGFTQFLRLAVQEAAIRLHREWRSRETVGVRWRDAYDPRYPDADVEPVPLFRFGPEGDEFMWDYVPKHYPEHAAETEPHADAHLEAEVTEYERWFKATYCR